MLMLKGETLKSDKIEKIKKVEPKMTIVQKVIKGETFLVMNMASVELEDEFSNLYWTTSNQSNLMLAPPFEPNVLMNFALTNNVLNQCIEAMEVNIDGTGHSFIAAEDGGKINKAEEKLAMGFFSEPYPNESFVKIRRKMRRQLESIGYAFLEVVRNVKKDVVGLRNIDTHHIRMVKLDTAVQVKKTLNRNGEDVEMVLWERERRFAQRVALKTLIYYKEFGCSRNCSRSKGDWEKKGETLPPDDQATELLILGIHPDIVSPYFVPRWINQLPSVIGSRNAEEQNLQFLDSGGMPPAIIFIQGGTLTKPVTDQLNMFLSGQNKNKNRAVVVEAQSSSGTLDAAGKVDVKVERFGAEKAQDAMFMKYDAATEEHVRIGFRLPPLFLGKAADYNFATAQTAYMVAEAQVFKPERDEFDEMINKTIIKALGFKTLKFRSDPITLKDIATQLKGMQLVKDQATRDSFLKEANTAMGTAMDLATLPQPDTVTATAGGAVPASGPTMSQTPHEELPANTTLQHVAAHVNIPPVPGGKGAPGGKPAAAKPAAASNKVVPINRQKKKAMELIDLAHDYASMRGILTERTISPQRALVIKEEVAELDEEEVEAFNSLLATYAFNTSDPELMELIGYTHEHIQ
jgi:PBSX family phage portal protein